MKQFRDLFISVSGIVGAVLDGFGVIPDVLAGAGWLAFSLAFGFMVFSLTDRAYRLLPEIRIVPGVLAILVGIALVFTIYPWHSLVALAIGITESIYAQWYFDPGDAKELLEG